MNADFLMSFVRSLKRPLSTCKWEWMPGPPSIIATGTWRTECGLFIGETSSADTYCRCCGKKVEEL